MLKNLLAVLVLLSLSASANASAASSPVVEEIPPSLLDTAPFNESVGPYLSTNWAGYTAEDGTYTAVGATWTIPSVEPAKSVQTDATWVGVGGINDHDLIQAGTQAVTEDGDVKYTAWYETLPDYQVEIPLRVHAGDSVSVSLREKTPGVWVLTFVNNTTAKSYQREISYDSSRSSAEWIQERPLMERGNALRLVPLDNFGQVTFTDAYAVRDGATVHPAQAGADKLSMVSTAGAALAIPSKLHADGSFSVTRAGSHLAVAETVGSHRRAVRDPWRDGFPDAPFVLFLMRSDSTELFLVSS